MRKCEPDSKHFGESLENEVFFIKICKNLPKMRNLFIVIYNRNPYSNPPPLGRGTSMHFGQKMRANFERTYLQGYLKLEARAETTLRHIESIQLLLSVRVLAFDMAALATLTCV